MNRLAPGALKARLSIALKRGRRVVIVFARRTPPTSGRVRALFARIGELSSASALRGRLAVSIFGHLSDAAHDGRCDWTDRDAMIKRAMLPR